MDLRSAVRLHLTRTRPASGRPIAAVSTVDDGPGLSGFIIRRPGRAPARPRHAPSGLPVCGWMSNAAWVCHRIARLASGELDAGEHGQHLGFDQPMTQVPSLRCLQIGYRLLRARRL